MLGAASWFVPAAWPQADVITIRFRAVVGNEEFACGRSYEGIGVSKTTIQPHDFRFYIHNVRLLADGVEVPLELNQDEKWQVDDIALLDFEDGRSVCLNGTPDMNRQVSGTVPSGRIYRGLKFTLGVPLLKNHLDLDHQPPPLDLTALYWGWTGGYKFARLDLAIPGQRSGFIIHLGSTGCLPAKNPSSTEERCGHPNRAEVVLPDFDPAEHIVLADLAALLRDTDFSKREGGCMSGFADADCAGVLSNLGLPSEGHSAGRQSFFVLGRQAGTK